MTRSTQASMKIEKGRSAGMNGGQLIKGHVPMGETSFSSLPRMTEHWFSPPLRHRNGICRYSSHEFFRNLRVNRLEYGFASNFRKERESNLCGTTFTRFLFFKNCEIYLYYLEKKRNERNINKNLPKNLKKYRAQKIHSGRRQEGNSVRK